MSKKGIVVKSVGGVFNVLDDKGNKTVCFSPKKFRYNDNEVIIGDVVKFDDLKKGKGIICEILPRKNKLLRPEIANVDACFIVLACEPQPDLYLADKILINCFQQKIEPIIVVNKTDLTDAAFKTVCENYDGIADILRVSAFDESVESLKDYIKNKTVCFAGQSAVGKTSILNALVGNACGEVGGLSQKTGRGMHTTRHTALYPVNGGYLADTCGFSLCDVKVSSSELRLYLDDFVTLSSGCKYASCTHTVEPDCAVRKAVLDGTLCKDRYERYVEEYNELVSFEKNQY